MMPAIRAEAGLIRRLCTALRTSPGQPITARRAEFGPWGVQRPTVEALGPLRSLHETVWTRGYLLVAGTLSVRNRNDVSFKFGRAEQRRPLLAIQVCASEPIGVLLETGGLSYTVSSSKPYCWRQASEVSQADLSLGVIVPRWYESFWLRPILRPLLLRLKVVPFWTGGRALDRSSRMQLIPEVTRTIL